MPQPIILLMIKNLQRNRLKSLFSNILNHKLSLEVQFATRRLHPDLLDKFPYLSLRIIAQLLLH